MSLIKPELTVENLKAKAVDNHKAAVSAYNAYLKGETPCRTQLTVASMEFERARNMFGVLKEFNDSDEYSSCYRASKALEKKTSKLLALNVTSDEG
jgi:hypothetical protein